MMIKKIIMDNKTKKKYIKIQHIIIKKLVVPTKQR